MLADRAYALTGETWNKKQIYSLLILHTARSAHGIPMGILLPCRVFCVPTYTTGKN